MIMEKTVETGKVITILFKSHSSKPLKIVIDDEKSPQKVDDIVYVSSHAPLAKAILNRKQNDDIEFEAPEGKLTVKIVKVDLVKSFALSL